jgi:hypothetical protein
LFYSNVSVWPLFYINPLLEFLDEVSPHWFPCLQVNSMQITNSNLEIFFDSRLHHLQAGKLLACHVTSTIGA